LAGDQAAGSYTPVNPILIVSAKPRKAAAKKVTAKEAVKSTGKNAGTHTLNVGPGLARDKSEPGKKKPSRSVSEQLDTPVCAC
jgi:hypothetical protein